MDDSLSISVDSRESEQEAGIRETLRQAAWDLSLRGLKIAAKWAAELLASLDDATNSSVTLSVTASDQELDVLLFARAMLDSGEYQRCAHMLRQRAQAASSPIVQFISMYSLYMAGEKMKEQQLLESEGRPVDQRETVVNPFLNDLLAELHRLHQEGRLDGFLWYMYGVVTRDIQRNGVLPETMSGCPSAKESLIESVKLYPWNWSAWKDLADLCLADDELPQFESGGGRAWWMYDLFTAHVLLEQQKPDQALQTLERVAAVFPNSAYVTTQVALAHYTIRNYDEAQTTFEQVREMEPHRLDQMDCYSNVLYVKERRAELSHLAHMAVRLEKFSPETCIIVGNYYSLKGHHEKAVKYFRRALRLNPKFLSAWTLMGHEYVELRNAPAAIEAYRRAVDINPRDYRAWYGLGQIYEMMHLYKYAVHYYKKAATCRPQDARMWCAIGNCMSKLDIRAQAMVNYERAVACGDQEGIATRELARLYREAGDRHRAAECYHKHINAYGDEMSAEIAEGILFLANYLKDRKDYNSAVAYCGRLLDYNGPEAEEAKAILREIRSATADADVDHGAQSELELSASLNLSISGTSQATPSFLRGTSRRESTSPISMAFSDSSMRLDDL